MIRIRELKNGYTLNYDDGRYEFTVIDSKGLKIVSEGDEVKTIDKFERWLKLEAKKGFPIECLKLTNEGWGMRYKQVLIYGKITSYDYEQKELWFTNNNGDRNKDSIRQGTYYYAITESNKEVITKLSQAEQNIVEVQQAKEVLLKTLEQPITPKYFEDKIAKEG